MDIIGFGALNVDLSYEISNEFATGIQLRSGKEQEGSNVGSLTQLLSQLESEKLLAKSGGGSAANTIVALSRMGFETGYLGKIGQDEEGDFLLSTLENVDVSHVIRGRGRSGRVLALQTQDQKDRSLLVFPEENDTIDPSDINPDFVNSAKIVHLTSFVGDRSFNAQVKTLDRINPNVMVSFDGGELYARRGLDQMTPILERAHIIFPSQEEVAILTRKNYKEGAKALLYLGAEIVVVKLSKEGCYVLTKNQEFHSEPFPADPDHIKDTIGAGDVFAAGFLAGILKHKSLTESARFANRVAAKSIQGFGRETYPTQSDLRNL